MSTIVHEIEETVTSPDEYGWQDSQLLEDADKCNVKFTNTVEHRDILVVDENSQRSILEYGDFNTSVHTGDLG
jgi:hypothetical protein